MLSEEIAKIDKLVSASKTKLINPIALLAALNIFIDGKRIFTREDLDIAYKKAVKEVETITKLDINIGGRFHTNTYPDRMASKYGVLEILGGGQIKLPSSINSQNADKIRKILLEKICSFQLAKIGNLQLIDNDSKRIKIAKDKNKFIDLLSKELERSANSFEITCFSILKIFLEKFACKLYRNSRTNARDSGVDIATDYGAIYQIKKFKIKQEKELKRILKEINTNFESSRIKEGKVVLIIDDIDKNYKHFIIGSNIKMIKKSEIINIASQIEEIEDRMKILRTIFEETNKELKSDV